jgi:hypothetical protein
MGTPRKSFKTEKGTELPLLNLKGKEYLQVMHRLVWFRERYPDGVIKTQLLASDGEGKDAFAVFRSEIYIPTERGPVLVATGHKRETAGGFADYMEKAESGSIGRALAMMGIGTQFAADDLDEGDRLADSPAPVLDKTTTVLVTQDVVTNGTVPTQRSSFRKNATVVNSNEDI